MKHPFLLISSLILVAVVLLLGWDLVSRMLTVANTACNISALFITVLVAFVNYLILKFSFKKFI